MLLNFKFSFTDELKHEDEIKFKEYLAMGRELITKLKVLATLEKASAMEKYEQSRVRKLSYAATEDTASGVGKFHVIFEQICSFNCKFTFTLRQQRLYFVFALPDTCSCYVYCNI